MALMACCAAFWSGPTAPMKLPSRTTLTRGILSAPLVSTDNSVALKALGRRTLPYIIPGRIISEA
jgi:hypothetical protein